MVLKEEKEWIVFIPDSNKFHSSAFLRNMISYNNHDYYVRRLRACLHGGGRPQVGEVTRQGGVTRLSI